MCYLYVLEFFWKNKLFVLNKRGELHFENLPKFIDSRSFPFANGDRRLWKWVLKAECQNRVSLLRQLSEAASSTAGLQVCLCAHFPICRFFIHIIFKTIFY